MNEGNIYVASGHGYSVKFSSSVKKSSKKLGWKSKYLLQ